jgi:hypothetical protein
MDRDWMQKALHADDRYAKRGQQQDERAQKRRDNTSSVIAERPSFRGRSCGQDMSVQRSEQRTLIDEIVSRVSDQSDTVQHPPAHELGDNDEGVQPQCKAQAGL